MMHADFRQWRLRTVAWLTVFMSSTTDAMEGTWITLDKLGDEHTYMWREGLFESLKRDGPWVRYVERTRQVQAGVVDAGRGLISNMAVNCLTGAMQAESYLRPDVDREPSPRRTLAEIERDNRLELDLIRSRPWPLYQAVSRFACDCRPHRPATEAISERQLRDIYARYYQHQRSGVEVNYAVINLDSEAEAKKIIAKLERGEPFEDLAARFSIDAHSSPLEGRGFVEESELPDDLEAMLRRLQPGEHSRTVRKGVFYFEVHRLIARRDRPAHPFERVRARIEAFVQRAHVCGWTL